MPVKIEVRDGENLLSALRRFKRLVEATYGRPWTKRRLGYAEKASELRRKRRKMRRINPRGSLRLHITLQALFRRTGPSNAAGR
jgi:ribosomal protein S21